MIDFIQSEFSRQDGSRQPTPPFSPARRSVDSMQSSRKTRPGPASGAGDWRSAPPRPMCAAPAGPRTRRLCATRSTSAGPGAIPDPQEGSFSPAGSSPPVRPGNGGPRWPPPPRFSGLLTTTRWKRRSRRLCHSNGRSSGMAQHTQTQAAVRPRGRAIRPTRQSVSACRLGG
jgi:hypothetical protein